MEKFCKTFYADISPYINDPKQIASRLGDVDGDRRARIERARYENTKAQLLCGGLILSAALSSAFGIKEFQVRKNDFGKPYLCSHPEIFFSISHSGERVICTICDVECGADIEDLGAEHPIMGLASRFLSTPEANSVMMSEDPNRAFCRLWTLRESYVKMRGRGFDIGLSTLRCDFHRGMASIYEGGILQNDAHFHELYGIIGYQASVCTAEEREHTVKKTDI